MKQKNTILNLNNCENVFESAFSNVYKNACSQNGFMEFDIFLFSNSFQEKLPIIYANIRV